MKCSLYVALAASVFVTVPAKAEMREMIIIGKISSHRERVFPDTIPAGVAVGQDYSIKLLYDTSTFSNLTYGVGPYSGSGIGTAAVVRSDFLSAVLRIGDFTWNIGGTNTTGKDVTVFQNMTNGSQFIDLNVGARNTTTQSTGQSDYVHLRISTPTAGLFNEAGNVFTTNAPSTTITASYLSFVHAGWDVRGNVTSLSWPAAPQVVDPIAGAVPEPATWAMMIGGFGLVGSAMRRRRIDVSLA